MTAYSAFSLVKHSLGFMRNGCSLLLDEPSIDKQLALWLVVVVHGGKQSCANSFCPYIKLYSPLLFSPPCFFLHSMHPLDTTTMTTMPRNVRTFGSTTTFDFLENLGIHPPKHIKQAKSDIYAFMHTYASDHGVTHGSELDTVDAARLYVHQFVTTHGAPAISRVPTWRTQLIEAHRKDPRRVSRTVAKVLSKQSRLLTMKAVERRNMEAMQLRAASPLQRTQEVTERDRDDVSDVTGECCGNLKSDALV